MADIQKEMLDEISALRGMLESVLSERTIGQVTFFENLPSSAVVGVDYVAYRFGVASTAVVRGRFGTDQIRRIRQKPIAFIKREVDAVFNQLHKPITETAAQYRYKVNNGTRKRKK